MGMKVCAEPGCPRTQAESRCADHRRQRERARGTRQDRGYDADYDRAARDYQRRMDNGTRYRCWRCLKPLGTSRGTDWQLGHCDDDRGVLHGPECPACNQATSGRRGERCPHRSHRQCEVTVVYGPPCSGKTTWVRERAQPSDLIVDYDDIAQRLGSNRSHNHDARFHREVETVIARAVVGIKAGRHERAWIIRTTAVRAQELATELGGRTVLIDAPDEVLMERAAMRPNPGLTRRAIREWRAAHGS